MVTQVGKSELSEDHDLVAQQCGIGSKLLFFSYWSEWQMKVMFVSSEMLDFTLLWLQLLM